MNNDIKILCTYDKLEAPNMMAHIAAEIWRQWLK